jgi:hypothetical protein
MRMKLSTLMMLGVVIATTMAATVRVSRVSNGHSAGTGDIQCVRTPVVQIASKFEQMMEAGTWSAYYMQKKMIQRDQDVDPIVDDYNVPAVLHSKHECSRLCTLAKSTLVRPSRHSELCSTPARLTFGWRTVRGKDVS